jgi:hypothetical protein
MPLWAFCVYILFNILIQCCHRCCIWYHLYNSVCHNFTCSFPISLIAPALAQTQYCILRLGEKGLWAQFRSNILRTSFRDTSLFIPLRIYLGTPLCQWWCLYWRRMLEPYVLGVHWRVPPVFRRKHPPWEAMEGASLSDSTHKRLWLSLTGPPWDPLLPVMCPSDIDLMSHAYRSSLDVRPSH